MNSTIFDEYEKDEQHDLRQLSERLDVAAVDGARDPGDAYLGDFVEELLRNARRVLAVDEQDEIVDHPVVERFLGHVVRTLVGCLLVELLSLEPAVLLQRRRQTGHLSRIYKLQFHRAAEKRNRFSFVCIISVHVKR